MWISEEQEARSKKQEAGARSKRPAVEMEDLEVKHPISDS
jgi:hypothetical protein